jgi:hypothetical protein
LKYSAMPRESVLETAKIESNAPWLSISTDC